MEERDHGEMHLQESLLTETCLEGKHQEEVCLGQRCFKSEISGREVSRRDVSGGEVEVHV